MSSGDTSPRRYRRRSARLDLRIQVQLSLADATEVTAETVTVSKYGAKIRVSAARPLSLGELLSITIPRGRRSRRARVVWLDASNGALYGVEISPAGSFWGVYFPTRDGEDPYVDPLPAPEIEPLPATPVYCTEVLPPAPPPPAPVEAAPDPDFQGHEFEAMLTGMSVARSLFTEKIMCTPTSRREATALVTNLLGAGTRIRLARLRDSAVGFARVLGVSRRREAGKWRIWVQLLD